MPMTPEEVRVMLRARSEQKKEKLIAERESIVAQVEEGKSTHAPNLTKDDINFLATTRVKLSQNEILKMYVGNWASLDLKQRRKVMGYVQA